MGEARYWRRKHQLRRVDLDIRTAAWNNFYMIDNRKHLDINDFLGRTLTFSYELLGYDLWDPKVAEKLHMLASPHHKTLYKAYCIKRGLFK